MGRKLTQTYSTDILLLQFRGGSVYPSSVSGQHSPMPIRRRSGFCAAI